MQIDSQNTTQVASEVNRRKELNTVRERVKGEWKVN